MFSKAYLVGLTDRNFIVLRVSSASRSINVVEVFGYLLDQLPEIRTTFGSFFGTDLEIKDPAKPFKIGFRKRGVPNNYQGGQVIANVLLSRWQQRRA